MKRKQPIPFDAKARLLEKARRYVESAEKFLADGEPAVSLMLRAMKHADRPLRREIMAILGSFAKNSVVEPLYGMMTDPAEDEETRHDAAIHLSVLGPLIKDSQALTERLLGLLDSAEAEQRLYATAALGWRGNYQAAIALVGRLYDTDNRVQQAAIGALCNLRDDRILELLIDRLEHGRAEERHVILLNLWRLGARGERVKEVYFQCLEHEDADVRFDALLCIRPITKVGDHVELYRKCVQDPAPKIRALALRRLADEAGESVLKSLRPEVEVALNDPDVAIKKAALEILRKLNSS
jgi:HEAT repeat protein